MYISRPINRFFIFLMFHTSSRECKLWRKKFIHFGNVGKNWTMSNICTAFRKLHMIVWSKCYLNFVSLRALSAREHRTQLLSTCLIFFSNRVISTKCGATVAYIYFSIGRKNLNYLTFWLRNICVSQFLVIRSLGNRPTRPNSRNNYPQMRYVFLGYIFITVYFCTF